MTQQKLAALMHTRIPELESTPGADHYQRWIARSIGNEKMVCINIRKSDVRREIYSQDAYDCVKLVERLFF